MQQDFLQKAGENSPPKRKKKMPKAHFQKMRQSKYPKEIFRSCPQAWEQLWEEDCQLINIEVKKKKIAKKPFVNFIQNLNYRMPPNMVFTLYGMVTISQKTLKMQTKDQSSISSVFSFYNLVQVQTNPNYMLLKIQKSKDNYYPIPYFIQRFRNYGDAYFYQLANKIQKLSNIMSSFRSPPPSAITDAQISECFQKLKGKAFLLRVTPGKLYFSNGFSVNEIAHECLNLRSFATDFFNADDYRNQIDKFFYIFDQRIKFLRGQLDPATYLESIVNKSIEYIAHKDEGMIKVLTNKYYLAPGITCWQVEQILSKEDINPQQKLSLYHNKLIYRQQKKNSELLKMEKLISMPQNIKIGNEVRVCSYKTFQRGI